MNLSGNLERSETQARKRLAALFDEGVFTEIDAFAKSGDGEVEVLAGFGMVNGDPVYAFSQDITVTGGAFSVAQSSKVKKVYDLAVKTGVPVVGIYDSNGIRLKEGVDALAAEGEMISGMSRLSGVVPTISVIAGSCIGSAAVAAVSADFVMMAKDAQMYLSGEQGTALESAQAGIVTDIFDDDISAVTAARELISRLPQNNLACASILEDNVPDMLSEDLDSIPAEKLTPDDIIKTTFDSGASIELWKEFGKGVYTAISAIGGITTGVVIYTDVVDSDAAAKAARFVRFCDAFAIPVVSFVNTRTLGVGAPSLRYTSMLVNAYAEATTAKVAVIAGNAYGAAYVVLAGGKANSDMVFAWENSVLSGMDPEAEVTILWNERMAAGEKRSDLVDEYKKTVASPLNAAARGYVDDVFSPSETRGKLITVLDLLSSKRVATLPKKHSNFPL